MLSIVRMFIVRHKLLTTVALICLAGGLYYFLSSPTTPNETKYTLALAERNTIVQSITGSGQVSVPQQIDVVSRISGETMSVVAKTGQVVKKDDVLIKIDSRDAQKSIRDARISLCSATLALQKLQQPASALSLLQAKNAALQAERDYQSLIKPADPLTLLAAQHAVALAAETKTKSNNDLLKNYDDAVSATANVFSDAPSIITGLYDILYGYTISHQQQNIDYYNDVLSLYNDRAAQYRQGTIEQYQVAKKLYDETLTYFKATSRFSTTSEKELALSKSLAMSKTISEAIKNITTYIRLYQESVTARNGKIDPISTSHITTLNTYLALIDGHVSTLSSYLISLQNTKDSLANADRTIAEKTLALDNLIAGPDADKRALAEEKIQETQENLKKIESGADTLDLTTQELVVAQRVNALSDAEETLTHYTIKAPATGTLAKINTQSGVMVNSGTAVATIIGSERTATVPLNEVDVAKISLNQKATLTFDAISDFSLTGKVSEIDTIGTVSQGVVTYNVKIAFDTQDDRIKPGMSVTAAIITQVTSNVISIASGAIKNRGSETYVLVPDPEETGVTSSVSGMPLTKPPVEKIVEIGASNGSFTEIKTGLTEGSLVITRVITTAPKTTAQTSATSLLTGSARGVGVTGGGLRTTNPTTVGR